MAVLRNSGIPNTFISASAERGSDGQISSHITLAKQHTGVNVAFIYLTGSFTVFGNIRKSSTFQGWKYSFSDLQRVYLNPHSCVLVKTVIQ